MRFGTPFSVSAFNSARCFSYTARGATPRRAALRREAGGNGGPQISDFLARFALAWFGAAEYHAVQKRLET